MHLQAIGPVWQISTSRPQASGTLPMLSTLSVFNITLSKALHDAHNVDSVAKTGQTPSETPEEMEDSSLAALLPVQTSRLLPI
jgi:hypothetical protein